MAIRLGDTAPNFTAETTDGTIDFHEWKGDSWAVLFSHPKDFTPVCTTELGYTAKLEAEFARRDVKVIGLSCDPVDDHRAWAADIEETQGMKPNFPMIGDADRSIATTYDMIHPDAGDTMTVRSVFVIAPDNKVKLTLTYPASTGRNFDEIVRVIDSLQLTAASPTAGTNRSRTCGSPSRRSNGHPPMARAKRRGFLSQSEDVGGRTSILDG